MRDQLVFVVADYASGVAATSAFTCAASIHAHGYLPSWRHR